MRTWRGWEWKGLMDCQLINWSNDQPFSVVLFGIYVEIRVQSEFWAYCLERMDISHTAKDVCLVLCLMRTWIYEPGSHNVCSPQP